MKSRIADSWKVVVKYLLTFLISLFLPLPLSAEDQYRLVITGDMMGAINECDCPGGQPGGLARRKSIFDAIRAETPDAVFIDCGKLFSDNMSEEEIILSMELLKLLDYDIISSTKHGYDILDSAKILNAMTYQNMTKLNGKLIIDSYKNHYYSIHNSDHHVKPSNLSINILNDDDFEAQPINPLAHLNFSLTDIHINYGSGIIDSNVEEFHHKVHTGPAEMGYDQLTLTIRPSMYGEHILVLDIWVGGFGRSILRYEWESIATETYPPDSTFQAKIDQIYKDKVDTRKK